MPTYEYPRPMMTADLVLFRIQPDADLSSLNEEFEVLLVRRKNPPFKGKWALPGGYVNEGETVDHAAVRECFEETGIISEGISRIKMIPTLFDHPTRDPRGWTISAGFVLTTSNFNLVPEAKDDAADAKFVRMTLNQLDSDWTDLAFDHRGVILCAFNEIASQQKINKLLVNVGQLS